MNRPNNNDHDNHHHNSTSSSHPTTQETLLHLQQLQHHHHDQQQHFENEQNFENEQQNEQQYQEQQNEQQQNEEEVDDNSQDFFSESSFDIFSPKLSMFQALDMIRHRFITTSTTTATSSTHTSTSSSTTNDNLSSMAFPHFDSLVHQFHQAKIFTLHDFLLHNLMTNEQSSMSSSSHSIKDKICSTCTFVFNQDKNRPFTLDQISTNHHNNNTPTITPTNNHFKERQSIFRQMKLESLHVLFFELTQLVLVRPVIHSLRLAQHFSISPTISPTLTQNEQLKRLTHCSLGDVKLDRLLNGGGLRTRCITELWGESSSGKTQVCMSLLANTVSPRSIGGMGCRAIYVHSEVFPVDRLSQMCDERFERIQVEKEVQRRAHIEKKKNDQKEKVENVGNNVEENDEEGDEEDEEDDGVSADLNMIDTQSDLMSRIFAVSVSTIQDFMTAVDTQLLQHCKWCERSIPIKLVIVDSITALFRTENALSRSAILGDVVNKLRRISDQFNLCILIVNQVTDHIPSELSSFPSLSSLSSGGSSGSGSGTGGDNVVIQSQMAYEAVLYSDPRLVEGEDEQDEMLRRYRSQFYLTMGGGRTRKKPALGLAWACYVNMSLMCSRSERPMNISFKSESPLKKRRRLSGGGGVTNGGEGDDDDEDQIESQEVIVRQLHVIFAPHLKNGTQSFIIERSGVRGIDICT